MIRSEISPRMTLEYMQKEHENKYFDRKSAKVRPADLAPLISAFANAEGGTIVIGIGDKTREIEGISAVGEDHINALLNAARDGCKPMPKNIPEFLDVNNARGEKDRLLLIHIFPGADQIIRTMNDSVYLRIGDKTREIKGDDLRNLEYSKNLRRYEDECSLDARIEDLDSELLQHYKEMAGAEQLTDEQVLRARGFMKQVNGVWKLTNAAVLLFAQNILAFYPNCRIRFIRYDGNFAEVGTQINIIKDRNFDCAILRLIDEAKQYISNQLREFTALNVKTGKFQNVPEYPEFAWLEGIVNAVVHREYAMSGDYILVTMYDDRLEIKSPGRLPGPVTIENIRETRYSRNPKISRVLNDFGYVRELNEGVKRIYRDMEAFFLDDPVYSEPGQQSVKLILKNNIVMRRMRQKEKTREILGEEIWEQLDDLERNMLIYMGSHRQVTSRELAEYTGRSRGTVNARLNHLLALCAIRQIGNKHDPRCSYEICWQS